MGGAFATGTDIALFAAVCVSGLAALFPKFPGALIQSGSIAWAASLEALGGDCKLVCNAGGGALLNYGLIQLAFV